jgi:hypothetical protein
MGLSIPPLLAVAPSPTAPRIAGGGDPAKLGSPAPPTLDRVGQPLPLHRGSPFGTAHSGTPNSKRSRPSHPRDSADDDGASHR